MLFHFSIFFWSVAFFLVMRFVAANDEGSFWNAYLFSVGLLSAISIISAKKITRRLRNSFIPLLISFSAPSLMALIDAPGERSVFAFISAGIFYTAFLALYRIRFVRDDGTARSFLSIAALSALFFFYSAEYGFYLNFSVPLASLVFVFSIGSFGVAYQTLYSALPNDRRRVFLYAFGYLTAGAAALAFFFILWDMALSLFLGTISRKRTIIYFLVSMGLIGLLIATSPWRIQV